MAQIDNMRIKLGIGENDTTQDDLIALYLADAEEDILTFTNLTAVPTGLLSTQVDMAIRLYNKRGIEGETAHSEGGISRSFEDLPDSIKRKLKSFRKLPPRVVE